MQAISNTDLKLPVINGKYSVVISDNFILYFFLKLNPKGQCLPQTGRRSFRKSMDYVMNHFMTYSENKAQNVYFSVTL
jgi:hypothetical protein